MNAQSKNEVLLNRSAINLSLMNLVPNDALIDSSFRYWQIEPLLISASEILDRCANHMRRIEALEESKLTRQIEAIRNQYNFELVTELNRRVEAVGGLSYLELQDSLDRTQLSELERQRAIWKEWTANLTAVWNESSDNRKQYGPAMSELELSKLRYEAELAQARIRALSASMDAARSRAVEKEIDMWNSVLKAANDACQPNMVQDYDSKIAQTKRLLDRDYQDSLDRLKAAAKGLKILFGYAANFDDALKESHVSTGDAIVSLTTMTRNALKWLSEFSGMDQGFNVSVSLLSSLDENKMLAFMRGEQVPFFLDEAIFSGYKFVRLRGISGCYLGAEEKPGFIRFKLYPPQFAKVAWSEEWSEVDQMDVPFCDLGKVAPYGFPQPQEIAGNIALMNVSPMSKSSQYPWRIQLSNDSLIPGYDLQDVFIDFRCNGRPNSAPKCELLVM